MEENPFSPWRSRNELTAGQLAEFDSRPASPLDDLWLTQFANLYRRLAGLMSPAEVDECEIWQLAVLLGGDSAEDDGVLSIEERVMSEQDQLKARLAAAGKGVRQETTIEPADGPQDVTAEIMRSMGITTK